MTYGMHQKGIPGLVYGDAFCPFLFGQECYHRMAFVEGLITVNYDWLVPPVHSAWQSALGNDRSLSKA